MTPAALILTSDFELCHMVRLAVERFGVDAGFALRTSDAIRHLEKNKFDLFVVDCSDPDQGFAALRQMRLHRSHRTAIAIAIVPDRREAKVASDSGATFVIERATYDTELPITLRTAYGLVLRERGRYNRFPLNATAELRCGEYACQAQVLNISQGGLCLRGVDARLDVPVHLKFALDEGRSPIQVTGNPVWHREERIGIQFVSMPARSRTELSDWLARQLEILAKASPTAPASGIGMAVEGPETGDQSRTFGKSGEVKAIVTAIIRGGPVRARCSKCQATITFGNTIGAPLDQERKLRDAFILHIQEKHPEEVTEETRDYASALSASTG